MKNNFTLSLLLFFLLAVNCKTYCQGPYYNWAVGQGQASTFSGGNGVKKMANGAVYVCGSVNNNIFIKKYSANGTVIWDKIFTGGGLDGAYSLTVDSAENIYLCGLFQNTIDVDPGLATRNVTAKGKVDGIILSLTASGTYRWAHVLGSPNDDIASTIHYDGFGNVYVAGQFSDTIDFDPGPAAYPLISFGYPDFFMLKLDTAGNFKWAKTSSSINYNNIVLTGAITSDKQGNVYAVGSYTYSMDVDPDTGVYALNSKEYYDIFVLQMDSAGNFKWAQSYGGRDRDFAEDITVDPAGNVYITGYFGDTVDFDGGPGVANFGTTAISTFIQKLDKTGQRIWTKALGRSASGYGVTVDANSDVFICGKYFTADFDPNVGVQARTANGKDDVFLLHLDSAGNYKNVTSLGGEGDDVGLAVAVDERGNIFLTGQYRKTVDFDPDTTTTSNLTSSGLGDFFLLALSPCNKPTYSTISPVVCGDFILPSGKKITTSGTYTDIIPNANGCDSTITIHLTLKKPTFSTFNYTACKKYVSPSGKNIWKTSGTYLDTLTNKAGCDSIITINLAIERVDTSIIKMGSTWVATDSANTYQWVDCANNYSSISGATTKIFLPVKNGNYAVIITRNNCTDTSRCVQVTGLTSDNYYPAEIITVYPNPNKGLFTIDFSGDEEVKTIQVFDISGRALYTETFANSKHLIHLEHLATGVYMLQVEGIDKLYYSRIVIE